MLTTSREDDSVRRIFDRRHARSPHLGLAWVFLEGLNRVARHPKEESLRPQANAPRQTPSMLNTLATQLSQTSPLLASPTLMQVITVLSLKVIYLLMPNGKKPHAGPMAIFFLGAIRHPNVAS